MADLKGILLPEPEVFEITRINDGSKERLLLDAWGALDSLVRHLSKTNDNRLEIALISSAMSSIKLVKEAIAEEGKLEAARLKHKAFLRDVENRSIRNTHQESEL